MSNRLVLVDREFCHPTIEGVDFGGKCWVICRSPAAVLVWVFGHSWSLNGRQCYAEPVLVLLRDRAGSGNLKYERLLEGGRLGGVRLATPKVVARLAEAFGADAFSYLCRAVSPMRGIPKRTLIIDGGGGKLMPARLGGEEEYLRWRYLPAQERGFRTVEAQAQRDRNSLGYRP